MLCPVSCSRKVFHQLSNWLAFEEPRPLNVGAELTGSSFVSGMDHVVRAVHHVRTTSARREESVLAQLRLQFGDIVDTGDPPGFMFPPARLALVDAFLRGGITSRIVDASLAFAAGVVKNSGDLVNFRSMQAPFEECAQSHLAFRTVVINTIVQHTVLNPPGLGRPQYSTAAVSDTCSNRGAWEESDESEVTAAEGITRLSVHLDCIQRGPANASFAASRALLLRVVCEVVRQSSTTAAGEAVEEEGDEQGLEDDEDDASDEGQGGGENSSSSSGSSSESESDDEAVIEERQQGD